MDSILAHPKELSGLLNKAIDAFSKVQQRGIDITPTMAEALKDFRASADPFAFWLNSKTELDPNDYIPKRELIDAYKAECGAKKRPPLSDKAFGTVFQKLHPNVKSGQRTINEKRQDVYLGIRLKAAKLVP